MLAKRIIPCLDVNQGQVVKGVRFRDHEVVGDIVELALRYRDEGADELVFYDITASPQARTVDVEWISRVAQHLDIPFCVAGGIDSVDRARAVLSSGADKISINSPALVRPELIGELASVFGQQCVVLGVDSRLEEGDYWVYQYTGDPNTTRPSKIRTVDWLQQAQTLGIGEVVLNCMDQDGVRRGYDCQQLMIMRKNCAVPLVASGGAGCIADFVDVFTQTDVDAALAASVFHKKILTIGQVKQALQEAAIAVRMV